MTLPQPHQCYTTSPGGRNDLISRAIGELKYVWHLFTDPTVPAYTKVFSALVGVAYLILPTDLIPDPLFGPGQMDDLGVFALMGVVFRFWAAESVGAAVMAGQRSFRFSEKCGSERGQLVKSHESLSDASLSDTLAGTAGAENSQFHDGVGGHRRESPIINIYNRYPGRGYCGLTALLVVVLAAGLSVWRMAFSGSSPMIGVPATPTRDLKTIVQRLQDIKRLETMHYFTEKVAVEEKSGCIFGNETLVVLFYGQGVMGIDLENLRENSIEVDEQRAQVTLRLPHPRLLHAFLDVGETKVAFHYVPPLCPSQALEMALTAEARARDEIQLISRDERYLRTSETNAKSFFEFLLREFGFSDVKVIFETPEAESGTMDLPRVEIKGTMPPLLTPELTETLTPPPADLSTPVPWPTDTPIPPTAVPTVAEAASP